MAECMKCGAQVFVREGDEFEPGDRCWQCLDSTLTEAVALLSSLYKTNAIHRSQIQRVEKWLTLNFPAMGSPRKA